MTEAEWQACTNPKPMLEFLKGKASDRRSRLIAVTCCRRIWDLLTDERSRRAVEAAEQFADGEIDAQTLGAAYAAAWPVVTTASDQDYCPGQAALGAAAPQLVRLTLYYVNKAAALTQAQHLTGAYEKLMQEGYAANCDLLRCIFGNPFQPVTADPAWLTPTVTNLAEAAYEERQLPSGHLDAARLGVLADALEDAGCDNADVLHHLRGPGSHVRGCWAIDLLLGKE
jgi:hypothetical protein